MTVRITKFKCIASLITICLLATQGWAEPKPSPYIYLEGEARDTGYGACLLQSPVTAIFLKGIEEWMPGMTGNGNASKYIVVGKLEESYDLPVTTNPAEARKKVLIPENVDSHQASHRWNLTMVEGMYQADPFAHPFRDHKVVKLDWTDDMSTPAVPNQERFYLEFKVPYKIHQSELNSAVEKLNKGGFPKVLVKFSGDNFKD